MCSLVDPLVILHVLEHSHFILQDADTPDTGSHRRPQPRPDPDEESEGEEDAGGDYSRKPPDGPPPSQQHPSSSVSCMCWGPAGVTRSAGISFLT